ncbi:hypothetical protein EJD97_013105, partial [Solanum chilense]
MRRQQVKKRKMRKGKQVKRKNFLIVMIHKFTFKPKNMMHRMIENISLSICFVYLVLYSGL